MLSTNPVVYALLSLLAAIIFLGGQYPGVSMFRAQSSWLLLGCLVVLSLAFPVWITLGVLVFTLHAWWNFDQYQYQGEVELVARLAASMGAILAIAMSVASQDVQWLLRGIACLTVPWAAWTAYSQWRYPETYSCFVGPVLVYERQPYPRVIAVGQGNVNYTEAIAGVLGAVSVGLLHESWWWWLAVLCAVSPILAGRWNRRHEPHGTRASQGDVYLLALVLLAVHPWAIAALIPMIGLGYRREGSERTRAWADILQVLWWPSPWRRKLLGRGCHGWSIDYLAYIQHKQTYEHWTHAHSEYVQVLYEYGVIGLVCLLGTLWTLLAHSTHPSVFSMGVVLCLVAGINNPWTFYHEFRREQVAPNGVVYKFTAGHGNLTLNMLSGLWMALALMGVAR